MGTRSDILQGQALFRGVKHLLTRGQKEKKILIAQEFKNLNS